MQKKIIISPPFGNYIERPWATSVKGTYTLRRRPGWLLRSLLTIRPVKGGWINNIGLRNPGIKSIKTFDPKHIYSIAAVDTSDEWYTLIDLIPPNIPIELNPACPNIKFNQGIPNTVFRACADTFPFTSLKIPPTHPGFLLACRAYDCGIRCFHVSNTIQTPEGGKSGTDLKHLNLPLIGKLRERYDSDIKIIAGGGIYYPSDVRHYSYKKVDYYSLATIWFTPWRVKAVKNFIYSRELENDNA